LSLYFFTHINNYIQTHKKWRNTRQDAA